jgi:hypothetical protein
MEEAQPISNEQSLFLKKVHDACVVMLQDVTFDQRFEKDGLLVGLYASLVELTGGFLVLVHFDRYAAVPPVSRTFLEGYVDFTNLFADPDYVQHIYVAHHDNSLKLLKRDNPNLSSVRNHQDYETSIRHHEEKLAKLRSQGFRELKLWERFKRAGLWNEYGAIYHLESDGAHNSVHAFISRHVEFNEEGFGLALYKRRNADAYNARIEMHTSYLLDATEKLHRRLESKHLAQIGGLRSEWERLRATFTSSHDAAAADPSRTSSSPA